MDIAVSMSSNEHATPPYDHLQSSSEQASPSLQAHRNLQQSISDLTSTHTPRRRHAPSTRTSPTPQPLHHFENTDMDFIPTTIATATATDTRASWRGANPPTITNGQDHDRMETDEEDNDTGSEDDMSSHHPDPDPALSTGNDETMDTTPDNPRDDEDLGDHLLGPDSQASTSSDEDGAASPNASAANQPQTTLQTSSTHTSAISGEQSPPHTPSAFLPLAVDTTATADLDGQQDSVRAGHITPPPPPPENPTTPPATGEDGTSPSQEHNNNQGDSGVQEGREADDGQEDDSSDEEERAYWADFVEDTSGPDEDELREIEQEEEKGALDHDHWETMAFEPLDDPEYIPGASGQIKWAVNPVNGSPDKPNREKIMRSPSVLIGGLYWNIKYFPRGNDGTEQMSVYVECSSSPDGPESEDESGSETSSNEGNEIQTDGEAPTEEGIHQSRAESRNVDFPSEANHNTTEVTEVPSDNQAKDRVAWEAAAQIGCIVYNPDEPRVNMFRKSCHQFTRNNPDWGWTRFHGPWETIHLRKRRHRQALLRNDTLAFTAYIRTVQDNTKSLWWHAPKKGSDWDSYEKIGIKSLATGSSRDSAIIAAVSCWLHLGPVVEIIRSIRISDAPPADPNKRKRPLFSALHEVLDVMSKAPAETDQSSMATLMSWLDWYITDIQMTRTDLLVPITVWESVRRILNYEASVTGNITAESDLFHDVLLLKQPDPWKHTSPISSALVGQDPENAKLTKPIEPCSVQETIDLASSIDNPFQAWNDFDGKASEQHKHPAVLQIELHRHGYDKGARRWNKLTHHIELNETIVYTAPRSGTKCNYTLFGFIVEVGALASQDCYSVIRPSGPGTRWVKFSGNPSHRGASCLTTAQAVTAHEGTGKATTGDSAVAHVVLYVKTDELSSILSSLLPHSQPQSSVLKDTSSPETDIQQNMSLRVYNSTVFKSHIGRGLPDLWAPVSLQDPSPVIDLRLSKTAPIGQEIERLDEGFLKTSKDPEAGDQPYTCGLWYLVSDNLSVQGLPRILPVAKEDTLEKVTDGDDVCRIWLHLQEMDPSEGKAEKVQDEEPTRTEEAQAEIEEGNSEPEDAVMTQDPPPEGSISNGELGLHDDIQVITADVATPSSRPLSVSGTGMPSITPEDGNEDDTNHGDAIMTQDPQDAPAEVSLSNPNELETNQHTRNGRTDAVSPPSAPQGASGDDVPPPPPQGENEVSASSDAPMGEAQDPIVSAETATLVPAAPATRLIYFFVKIFDLETQELRGVGSKLVALESDIHTEVGRMLGSEEAMELYLEKGRVIWEDDQVRPSRSFSDYELRDGCILIAHRRPSSEEATLLVTQGKHTNPITYFQHLRYNEPYRTTHDVKSEYGTEYHSLPLSNGLIHGSGTKIYSNGDAYVGNWVSNRKCGYGTMAYSSGDTYEGNWEHDEPEGEGKMVYGTTKNVYVGGWKKGRRHGKGVMNYEVADEELAMCKICYESEMDALFYDCGHVVACEECARQVDVCPVCRKNVRAVCRIWKT
ncbi:MAG: hypothetical protein Q9209_005516 [Squamulea sp. 1 TL-2023]